MPEVDLKNTKASILNSAYFFGSEVKIFPETAWIQKLVFRNFCPQIITFA